MDVSSQGAQAGRDIVDFYGFGASRSAASVGS